MQKKSKNKDTHKETVKQEKTVLNPGSFVGIVFLAAGIFNLPSIMKKQVTNSDWMMLVIVIFFIVLGLFAILLPKFIHKK
jgi:uncharacterized membrane protein HdeD (DUF308 family)